MRVSLMLTLTQTCGFCHGSGRDPWTDTVCPICHGARTVTV